MNPDVKNLLDRLEQDIALRQRVIDSTYPYRLKEGLHRDVIELMTSVIEGTKSRIVRMDSPEDDGGSQPRPGEENDPVPDEPDESQNGSPELGAPVTDPPVTPVEPLVDTSEMRDKWNGRGTPRRVSNNVAKTAQKHAPDTSHLLPLTSPYSVTRESLVTVVTACAVRPRGYRLIAKETGVPPNIVARIERFLAPQIKAILRAYQTGNGHKLGGAISGQLRSFPNGVIVSEDWVAPR